MGRLFFLWTNKFLDLLKYLLIFIWILLCWQKITKEGAPGQEDTDKECTSVRSSRHKSGRSDLITQSSLAQTSWPLSRFNLAFCEVFWITLENGIKCFWILNLIVLCETSYWRHYKYDVSYFLFIVRSNNSIASASTRSRKRLNWTMEMNTAPQVNVLYFVEWLCIKCSYHHFFFTRFSARHMYYCIRQACVRQAVVTVTSKEIALNLCIS